MTDRERWIVYPLLFLALGAALRDKLAKQTRAKQIVCEQILLVDAEGRQGAVLTGGGLSFDLGGPGNGLIKANAIDAQALFERGQPVRGLRKQPTISLQQLLQSLPQQLKIIPQDKPPQVPPAEADDEPTPENDGA